MRRLNVYPRIETTTHGNQNKIQRVTWALQGRFEHGKVYLQRDDSWNKDFEDQFRNFPSHQVHDDMMDALSYIDQIAVTNYWDASDFEQEEYVPMDAVTGY
jgi:phage terminase large subunit-like protein